VLAVVVPAGAEPAALVPVVPVVPVVLVPGAVVPLGAAVALPAGRVAAAEPAAVVGALVAAAPPAVVAAVVGAAGFGVSVALVPPQAARTIGMMRLNSANDVTRPHRVRPRFHPIDILLSPYVCADCLLRRENG
jgi:hypothetical protein